MDRNLLVIFGFLIIFFATSLGSALVFCLKNNISQKINSLLLGLSSGVMLASLVWSLLLPAIEQSSSYNNLSFLPASIGFLLGGLFLIGLDKITLLINKNNNDESTNISLTKPFKLFVAITIHNIPEGLAVGFAFGGALIANTLESYLSAFGLAIGIAIQNLPEGAAVSLPFKTILNSRLKSFLFGVFSGIVEPIAAILGYFLSASIISAQPWLLSFAAGAMFFVVINDLVPSAKLSSDSNICALGAMVGFVIMMALDVALG